MAPISEDRVREALKGVKFPGFSRDIVSFGLVQEVKVDGTDVHVILEHGIDDLETLSQIKAQTQSALDSIEGVGNARLELRGKAAAPGGAPQPAAASQGAGHSHGPGHDHSHGPAKGPAPGPLQGGGHGPAPGARGDDPWAGQAPLPGVKAVVAVASAKGGVGKSTVATNLALSLSAKGLKTGLLDADIYGPSLPTMLGVEERPEVTDERKIHPIKKDGIELMSIGFLVPRDKAMIWRGPMVMAAVQQFLGDVMWGDLDVLVVDLPPGTGDAQLTLVQRVPLSGVVMVTTPQDVALIDVVRGIQMFQETNAPIIGVVENMSGYVCSSCGHEEEIFGKGGGKTTSERYGVPFLGSVPIEPAVARCGDEGRPIVVAHPESASAKAFAEVADGVERFLTAAAEKAHAG